LKIKHFRGVFMRQALPEKAHAVECGIINLDDLNSNGTHWTCYLKNGDETIYFDSYGDSKPPKEFVRYIGPDGIKYNSYGFQTFNDPPICGHLCLEVLRLLDSDIHNWDSTERILLSDKYEWLSWFCNR
jgi:hypothetical protein